MKTEQQCANLLKWIEDLETIDPNKQGKGQLHNLETDQFCCLGRACVALGVPNAEPIRGYGAFAVKHRDGNNSYGIVPEEWFHEEFGLYNPTHYATLNDQYNYTFKQIAEELRKQLDT